MAWTSSFDIPYNIRFYLQMFCILCTSYYWSFGSLFILICVQPLASGYIIVFEKPMIKVLSVVCSVHYFLLY